MVAQVAMVNVVARVAVTMHDALVQVVAVAVQEVAPDSGLPAEQCNYTRLIPATDCRNLNKTSMLHLLSNRYLHSKHDGASYTNKGEDITLPTPKQHVQVFKKFSHIGGKYAHSNH